MEKLTNLEEMIMKCIWDYGEEIPFLQIGKELKERYSKEYKRTSIRTYLFRLEDKEYLKVDKRGRNAYVYPIISEKEYRKEKAEDINEMFADKEVKMIWCAKGGNNSNSTFEYLDYELIKKNPKIICGYSDITSLTNIITEKTGLITFSGTNFKTIATDETDFTKLL